MVGNLSPYLWGHKDKGKAALKKEREMIQKTEHNQLNP
jgi:hypothetical protein